MQNSTEVSLETSYPELQQSEYSRRYAVLREDMPNESWRVHWDQSLSPFNRVSYKGPITRGNSSETRLRAVDLEIQARKDRVADSLNDLYDLQEKLGTYPEGSVENSSAWAVWELATHLQHAENARPTVCMDPHQISDMVDELATACLLRGQIGHNFTVHSANDTESNLPAETARLADTAIDQSCMAFVAALSTGHDMLFEDNIDPLTARLIFHCAAGSRASLRPPRPLAQALMSALSDAAKMELSSAVEKAETRLLDSRRATRPHDSAALLLLEESGIWQDFQPWHARKDLQTEGRKFARKQFEFFQPLYASEASIGDLARSVGLSSTSCAVIQEFESIIDRMPYLAISETCYPKHRQAKDSELKQCMSQASDTISALAENPSIADAMRERLAQAQSCVNDATKSRQDWDNDPDTILRKRRQRSYRS